jgi:hypothetical protein
VTRQMTMERPAIPIGPVHHGSDGEAARLHGPPMQEAPQRVQSFDSAAWPRRPLLRVFGQGLEVENARSCFGGIGLHEREVS